MYGWSASVYVCRSAAAIEFTWSSVCVCRSAAAIEFTWSSVCVCRNAAAMEFMWCIHTHQCVFVEMQWLGVHMVYTHSVCVRRSAAATEFTYSSVCICRSAVTRDHMVYTY